MTNESLVGPWIRRFLLEHLAGERNLARNTQISYRDTLILLIPFVAGKVGKPVDRLAIEHVSADLVRLFLVDLEQSRGSCVNTRNQRLAAIHALARFVGEHSPEHIAWCGEIRAIPFKKATKAVLPYLDKAEMDALLASPDPQTAQGHRDHALLLFLYNSGARADEAAHVTIADLGLIPPAFVKLLGKGNKERCCPLWPTTAGELTKLVAHRGPRERVFLNRRGQPITRFGIHTLVKRCVLKASRRMPSQPNELARIRFDTPLQCTFCGQVWTSTRSARGLDTCPSIPPTCTQR
jgi:integrase/recombinase XerD